MSKGRISIEDAQLVHDFAKTVQKYLDKGHHDNLIRKAQTVERIGYCCAAEARQNARAERAKHHWEPQ